MQYSGHSVEGGIERVIDHQVEQWVRRISRLWLSDPATTRTFDIASRIQFLRVGIISQLSLGESFGCVENDSDQYNFLSSIKSGMQASPQMSVLHELTVALYNITRIPYFHRILVPSAKDTYGVGRTLGVCDD